MAECLNLQKSVAWCKGTPELPGIMRRIYYLAKSEIAQWPALKAENGRISEAKYNGDFVLNADVKWKHRLSRKKVWIINRKHYLCIYGNKDIGTISTYSTTE